MSLRRTSFVLCLLLAVLCLAAGFGSAGQWIGVGMAILMGPLWWAARAYPVSWLPFLCLLGSVSLAGAGVLTGAPPLLMIFGSTAALGAWDILSLDPARGSGLPAEQTRRYETEHFRSLALALGGALLLILLGRFLRLQLSFPVLLLSIALLLFALDRAWSFMQKSGKA